MTLKTDQKSPEESAAVAALRRQLRTRKSSLSQDLLETVFRIEERVQFDALRGDAVSQIRRAVQAALERPTEAK